MNVLFLTLSSINSIYESTIYTDLLREFIKEGHNVYIVSPIERKYNKQTHVIEEDVCKILRVRVGNIQKTNFIEKGISTILLEREYMSAIKRYFNNVKFDLILYSTPPITLVNVIDYLKKRDGARTYLLLKDIFPQNAVDLGVLSKKGIRSIIYYYFRSKEKKLYKVSDYIGCMSQANVEFILENNPEILAETMEVCPNSIEPLIIEKDRARIAEIKAKYKIPNDKTIFIYGGNLGKPQAIDFIIDCLKANKFNNLMYILIVGSGTEFNKLKTYFDSERPSNAQLINFLPKDEYEVLACSCDVGLIFLDKRFTIPNFPSRLLSYMQSSMPVLAATDTSTDIGKVIQYGNFGYWCESDNVEQFCNNAMQLCDATLRIQMGKNARKYLEDNYTAKHSYDIIMQHFK